MSGTSLTVTTGCAARDGLDRMTSVSKAISTSSRHPIRTLADAPDPRGATLLPPRWRTEVVDSFHHRQYTRRPLSGSTKRTPIASTVAGGECEGVWPSMSAGRTWWFPKQTCARKPNAANRIIALGVSMTEKVWVFFLMPPWPCSGARWRWRESNSRRKLPPFAPEL